MTAALVFADRERSGAETDARAAGLASGLARLGIEDGDVVAVMLKNQPAYIDVIQACRIAGAYFCQINWHFKRDEAGYILADCGAKVLVVQTEMLAEIAGAIPAGVAVIVTDAVADAAGRIAYEPWLAAHVPYAGPPRKPRGHMAYTSGTTGRPKGVRRQPATPEQLALAAQVFREALGIYPGVRSLLSAPLYHSAPSSFAQQSMLQGELLVLEEKFDAEATLALIERHRIETAYLVPVMYVRLLRLPAEVRARYDLSSLSFVASTGSPCAPEVKRAMIDWLGPVIYESYASSETGYITVMDPRDAARKPGSACKAVGTATIRILDEQGRKQIGRAHV